MKSKFITTSMVLFFSVFLFSAAIYAQPGNIIGKWVLQSLTENGGSVPLVITETGRNIPLVGDRPVERKILAELWLTKGSFSMTPACNSSSGKYTVLKSGGLKFTQMRHTAKGCSREAHEIDRRLAAALSKATKYKIRGGVLTLQDAGGQNILTFTSLDQFLKPKGGLRPSKKISVCQFTFSAPRTLKDLKVKGIDSCVASYEDQNLRIAVDYGWYGAKPVEDASTFNFKEEIIEVDGEPGRLVTFSSGDKATGKKYFASLYVALTSGGPMTTSLSMTISGKSEKDLETAREIFRTIKFH